MDALQLEILTFVANEKTTKGAIYNHFSSYTKPQVNQAFDYLLGMEFFKLDLDNTSLTAELDKVYRIEEGGVGEIERQKKTN